MARERCHGDSDVRAKRMTFPSAAASARDLYHIGIVRRADVASPVGTPAHPAGTPTVKDCSHHAAHFATGHAQR
jgi:hypothetical protein